MNLKRPKPANGAWPWRLGWRGIAIAGLALVCLGPLGWRATVLAQDAGEDFDSGGDSIRVTGGVEGAPATPAADTADLSAPDVTAPAPRGAAPAAVAAAPAPSPATARPATAPLSVPAVAAAPAAEPSFAASAPPPTAPALAIGGARPAIPIAEPTVAEAPALAPPEPAIPVATAPSAAAPPAIGLGGAEEEKGGAEGEPAAEAAAKPAAKPKTEVASATSPSNGFPGSQFGAGHGPIDIKSDTMALDYNGKAVLFTGHVRAIQAGGQLTSDKLKVTYGDNFHDVKEMFADGNVRISQGSRWATGDHAVLDQTKHTVVLTGSPVVHEGPDQITGRRIIVHLDTGQSVVEGARAVIFPKSGESASSGTQSAPADGAPSEHLP